MTRGYFPADRPALTVDVVIFRLAGGQLQTLLVRRAGPPYKNRWAIPGGFVRADEGLEDAARRELFEETGLGDVYLDQLYTFGSPKRDPRGRVVSVVYFALIGGEERTLKAGDDAADARWHPMAGLPELAFDHKAILNYALKRLRYKLEYSAVGFELLPAEFTLAELQTAYETILGEPLDKRNFRRRILEADVIEETEKYRTGQVGPRAMLYRYRPVAVAEVKARRLFP